MTRAGLWLCVVVVLATAVSAVPTHMSPASRKPIAMEDLELLARDQGLHLFPGIPTESGDDDDDDPHILLHTPREDEPMFITIGEMLFEPMRDALPVKSAFPGAEGGASAGRVKIKQECPIEHCKDKSRCPLRGGMCCDGGKCCCPQGSVCMNTTPCTCVSVANPLVKQNLCTEEECGEESRCPSEGQMYCCIGGSHCCPSGHTCVPTLPTPKCLPFASPAAASREARREMKEVAKQQLMAYAKMGDKGLEKLQEKLRAALKAPSEAESEQRESDRKIAKLKEMHQREVAELQRKVQELQSKLNTPAPASAAEPEAKPQGLLSKMKEGIVNVKNRITGLFRRK